jgi:hypothetical protein
VINRLLLGLIRLLGGEVRWTDDGYMQIFYRGELQWQSEEPIGPPLAVFKRRGRHEMLSKP